ncbi:MAG: HAD-IIB family hydrolase [Anaerovoracaceae bacterium]
MNRKYFFFDIDGTLLAGKMGVQHVPESTKQALRMLEEKGHFLSIATGRGHAMAEQVMKDLGFHNMVSDGGHGLTVDDKLLEIRPLDFDKCIALIDECTEKGLPWSISPENERKRFSPDDRFSELTKNDAFMETIVEEGLNPRKYNAIYKVYIACRKPVEYSLEALKELPWCRYDEEYFFVEPTDKAEGIIRMVEMMGGSIKDVVVFGDGRNDLSMFTDQWTSIAMGNAVDELKAKASYVTTAADADGIYNACKHYGWI